MIWRAVLARGPATGEHTVSGNSPDKLRHPRSDAYSAQLDLLNKQQIWCGGAYQECYPVSN